MTGFKFYDYLSFILPGALLLGAVIYGYWGWPWKEPGIAATMALVAASYVAGHLNSAIALVLQPILFGQSLRSQPPVTHGLFETHGHFDKDEEAEIKELFDQEFGAQFSFETQYNMAYTLLQQNDADRILRAINEQIGFYRNMAIASVLSIPIVVTTGVVGPVHLNPWIWVPALATAAALFTYRFRWFWNRFAHNVIRGALVLLRPASN